MRLGVLLLAIVFTCSCGFGDNEPIRQPSGPVDIKGLRAKASSTIYWVGREFEGLPITHAAENGLVYGTCEIPNQGLFAEGGCAPPVQIQHWEFRPEIWARAVGCTRLPSLRGVPTARHDGLVLFTKRQFVKIYAVDNAQERRIAAALRPLDGPRTRNLPPPPPDIIRRIRQACG